LGQGTGSAFGAWLIADLHGNIVAAVSPGSSPALLSAYRYDAYGETCGSWSAGSGSIAVPWRFQGRLLESATGGTDLYDFGARSYDPSLGAFTSFDSVAGSAQNPLTLNRYLYANANPATLVDPDGHAAWQSTCRYDPEDCADIARAKAHAKPKASALSGTTDMTTAVNNFRSWSANTDMSSAVYSTQADQAAAAAAAAEEAKHHCNGPLDCLAKAADGFQTGFLNMPGDTIRSLVSTGQCALDTACISKDPLGTLGSLSPPNPLKQGIQYAQDANNGDYYGLGRKGGNAAAQAVVVLATMGAGSAFDELGGVARGAGGGAAGGPTSVGRWMSEGELTKMQTSGRVVEGGGGRTYVTIPPDPAAYLAGEGVFVEFQVPSSSVFPASQPTWGVIHGPNAGTAIYGTLPDEMPLATCIRVVCRR